MPQSLKAADEQQKLILPLQKDKNSIPYFWEAPSQSFTSSLVGNFISLKPKWKHSLIFTTLSYNTHSTDITRGVRQGMSALNVLLCECWEVGLCYQIVTQGVISHHASAYIHSTRWVEYILMDISFKYTQFWNKLQLLFYLMDTRFKYTQCCNKSQLLSYFPSFYIMS